MVFNSLKRFVKGGSSGREDPKQGAQGEKDEAETGANIKEKALYVTHHLSHTLKDVTHVAWDSTRKVLAVGNERLIWVIGQGWATRRFGLPDEAEAGSRVLCIMPFRTQPSFLVAKTNSINILDYDTGIMNYRPALPSSYSFSSATAAVSESWVLVGRTDGVIQVLSRSCSETKLQFDLFQEIPGADLQKGGSCAITNIVSRMFHKQIVIVMSERSGLCQVNFARKELLSRFALSQDSGVSCIVMCAMDKYLLCGNKDGRITVWKANDETKKKTSALPPMLIVPARTMSPVTTIECYGTGTEDKLLCRWVAFETVVEGVLRPKDPIPAAVSMNVIYTSDCSLGDMCGLTGSSWPERTELPHQVMVVRQGRLLHLVCKETGSTGSPPALTTGAWRSSILSCFSAGGKRPVSDVLRLPSLVPMLLAHSPRSATFPWTAGGRPAFHKACSSAASILLAADEQGYITPLKCLPHRDAVAPHALRCIDSANELAQEPSELPGGIATAQQGNAVLVWSCGHVHWIDMVSLAWFPVQLPEGFKATCSTFIGWPLHHLVVGGASGELLVLKPGASPVRLAVTGGSRQHISALCASQSSVGEGRMTWLLVALYSVEGKTEMAAVIYDPEAPEATDTSICQDEAAEEGSELEKLLPQPLLVLERYTLEGAGTSRPRLLCVTPATLDVPTSSASCPGCVLPFNKGPRVQGIQLLPPAVVSTFVIRMAHDTFDRSLHVRLRLVDAAGFDALEVRLERAEKAGFASLAITWYNPPFQERQVVQSAEVLELPLTPGEDNLHAVRISSEKPMVVTFCSVDAARVPTNEQVAAALKGAAVGDYASGGPMWSVKHITPLEVSEASEREGGYRPTVLSAVSEPPEAIQKLQIFDDLCDPDVGSDPVLSCVNASDEVAAFTPSLSTNYQLHTLIAMSNSSCLQQIHVDLQRTDSSIFAASPPLRVAGKFIEAHSIDVATVFQFGLCAFIWQESELLVVQLPLSSEDAVPLLRYSSESLASLHIRCFAPATEAVVHVLGVGGQYDLVHLILSRTDSGIMCDIDEDMADDAPGPFVSLPSLQPRPQVKAPGMGRMTMKSMFRNHDKEVFGVDSLIKQVVEESFDDFTARVLPEHQRKELYEGLERQYQKEQKDSMTATSSVVSDVKDVMAKNKEMLGDRGEKISELEQNMRAVEKESADFLEAARKLNERQKNKKWWQL